MDRIFIDESGNFGLNAEHIEMYPFAVVGFVYSKNPVQLASKIRRLLKKMHNLKRYGIQN